MKATIINRKEFVYELEKLLSFGREQYAEAQENSPHQIVSFDDFLINVHDRCEIKGRDIDYGKDIAERLFLEIPKL